MNDFERVYYEIFLSKKSFFHFFVTVVWFRPYSWKSGCLKILKKSNAREFFLESVRLWDPSKLLLIFLNLSKATFGNFRVLKGNKGLNLLSQYTRQPSIPDKIHFDTLRQSCGNVTMPPWIVHIWRSLQSWHNIDVEKTLWIWLGISALYQRCNYIIHDIL